MSLHAQLNGGGNREVKVFQSLPSFALIVKAVDVIDSGTLVVASQQEEVFGVYIGRDYRKALWS